MRIGGHLSFLPWALAAVPILLPAGCGRHAGQEMRPPRTENVTLHVISQSGLQGEVVPCGWHGKKGGLARRAAFIANQRAEQGRILLVEGGDFFHRIPNDRKHESILAWRELERLECDAVALGELELRRWALTDSLLRAGSTLPLVTTNIERRVGEDRWQPLGARYRVVDVSGVRIAFLSVLPEGRTSTYAAEQAKGELRILPGLATTREAARLLKGKARPGSFGKSAVLDRNEAEHLARERVDLIVLLGYLDRDGTQAYADSLPEIDVILGGVRQARDEKPVRLGHAIVNRSGQRGVAVAVTDLVVTPTNEITEFSGRTVELVESMPEDPEVAALAKAAKEASDEEAAARRALKRKLREEEAQRDREARRGVEGQPISPSSSDPEPAPPASSGPQPAPRVRGRAH